MNSYSTSWWSLLLINRPREDERLSLPCWLAYSGRFTHINGYPSAAGPVQTSESSPVRDRCSTTEPLNQQWKYELALSDQWRSTAAFAPCICPVTLIQYFSIWRAFDSSCSYLHRDFFDIGKSCISRRRLWCCRSINTADHSVVEEILRSHKEFAVAPTCNDYRPVGLFCLIRWFCISRPRIVCVIFGIWEYCLSSTSLWIPLFHQLGSTEHKKLLNDKKTH